MGNPIDASRCFVPLARRFGHASLSLQDAVKPLLQRGVLNVSTVFEEPIWHHPNVEGHRWLAAIVARFLDDAVRSKVRFLLKQGSQGAAWMRPSSCNQSHFASPRNGCLEETFACFWTRAACRYQHFQNG